MLRTVTTITDSGPGSLRRAIAQARPGDTITFARGLAGRTITLNRSINIAAGQRLTIDGSAAPGLTLSGNGRHRIFQVNSNQAAPTNLVLKRLALANGYTAERGGAVHVAHRGALTVAGVTFRGNVADQGGGAIFTEFEGRLRVSGSRFEGNRATAGNNERGAGAIAYWGPNPLQVRNSTFIRNAGINGGAINSLNAPLTIENSRFLGNRTVAARFDGGKPRPFLRGYGGAIYADRASSISNATSGAITITGSTFRGNVGRGEGGAAYLYTGSQDRVSVAGSYFRNNRVVRLPGGNDGNGGAIVQLSDGLNRGFTVNNTQFIDNSATNQGGGIWTMDAPTTINRSTFAGNRTTGQTGSSIGGGMAIYSPTTITGSIFANNRAGWVGGALSASRDDRVAVGNSIFDNNTADNGPNDWNIQQHTNRELIDLGNNFQFPPKRTNNFNDYNVTATIRTDLDPRLVQRPNGTFIIGNPRVSLRPPAAAKLAQPEAFSSEDPLGQSGVLVGEGDRLTESGGAVTLEAPIAGFSHSGLFGPIVDPIIDPTVSGAGLADLTPTYLGQGKIDALTDVALSDSFSLLPSGLASSTAGIAAAG